MLQPQRKVLVHWSAGAAREGYSLQVVLASSACRSMVGAGRETTVNGSRG